MVELYELNMMPSNIDDCWPSNMDEHVAQLDFGASMMDGHSVFASVVADPNLISTDSLDMMEMLKRCQENKDDYKLTFEDSGQWTTSGIGGSFTTTNTTGSPPTPQTRKLVLRRGNHLLDQNNHNISLQLLEKLNDGTVDQIKYNETTAMHWRDKLLDELLNNNSKSINTSQIDCGEFTTWGRIKDSTEAEQQPFDSDKVNSLHEVSKSSERRQRDLSFHENSQQQQIDFQSDPRITQKSANRKPGALISTFIEQIKHKDESDQEDDGDNYGYSEVYLGNGRYIDMNKNEIGFVPPNTAPIQSNIGIHQSDGRIKTPNNFKKRSISLINKSPRTFADLSSSETAPDLKFIALSHKVPSICNSSATSYDNLLKQAKEGNIDEVLECCTEKILSDQQDESDSGLGSSHSEGPSHIEDWPSLSFLLPRHVVDACSFFKTNSFLLGGSTNNVERQCCPPRSFTTTEIHRPATACYNCLQEISITPEITKSAVITRDDSSHRTTQNLRLHAKELTLIGLPIYDRKRNLIERVVEGVAEVIRGGSSIVLLSALDKLLKDGLKPGIHPWDVIKKITGKGPVTASVFLLIEELEATEKPENSRVSHFFQGLVGLYSVDGWFSYIVLKENLLCQFYAEDSFFTGAHTSYRSLFSRFIECLELLSVFNQCGTNGRRSLRSKRKQHSLALIASKVPNDSRIPKSSSFPTKVSNNANLYLHDMEVNGVEHNIGKDKKITKEIHIISEPNEYKKSGSRPSKIPLLLKCRTASNSSHHLLRKTTSNQTNFGRLTSLLPLPVAKNAYGSLHRSRPQ